ncbi:hypothetical protein VTK56DRAFT_7324 [Thermocarpiscus australiensis]
MSEASAPRCCDRDWSLCQVSEEVQLMTGRLGWRSTIGIGLKFHRRKELLTVAKETELKSPLAIPKMGKPLLFHLPGFYTLYMLDSGLLGHLMTSDIGRRYLKPSLWPIQCRVVTCFALHRHHCRGEGVCRCRCQDRVWSRRILLAGSHSAGQRNARVGVL